MRRLTSITQLVALLSIMATSLLCSPLASAIVPTEATYSQAGIQAASVPAGTLAAESCTGPAQGTGKISGNVTALDTGKALASVVAIAYTSDGLAVASAQTNAAGDYTISKLVSGSYIVEFSPPDVMFVPPSGFEEVPYLKEYYNNQRTFTSASPVTVTEPNTATQIDAKLERGAKISGTVTSSDTPAHGLAGIRVMVYDDAGGAYRSIVTMLDGTYTIQRLPAGDYKVGFEPPDTDASATYVQEYYDDKQDLASAVLIPVTLGSSTTINSALQKGGQIAGKVTGTTGNGLLNVGVQVFDGDDNLVDTAITAADGTYTTSGLRPGAYQVRFAPSTFGDARGFIAEYYNNKPDLASATPVAVTQSAVTPNINGQLEAGAQIAGKVTGTAGVALGNVTIWIYDSAGRSVGVTGTANDGTYSTASLQPGSYRLEFKPPSAGAASTYAAEFYTNKPDLASATPVAVIKSTLTPNINVQLEPGAQIAGKVTAQNGGTPIANATVAVYDSAGALAGSTKTGSDGTYLTSGLRTGTYRVVFDPSDFQTPAYASEFYDDKPTLALATPVQVTQPQVTSNINAQLVPGGCIYGQVTAADTGDTLNRVAVTLYNSAGQYVMNTSTEFAGTYKFVGLATGDYTIAFELPATGTLARYAPEYYNDQLGEDGADKINVTAPNAATKINAVLERGGFISGRVTSAAGNGLENVVVRFYDAAGTIRNTFTDVKGNYRSSGLRPGTYKVSFAPLVPSEQFAPEFYNDKPDLASANPVTVTAKNTTSGINATLGPAGQTKIRVYMPLTRK